MDKGFEAVVIMIATLNPVHTGHIEACKAMLGVRYGPYHVTTVLIGAMPDGGDRKAADAQPLAMRDELLSTALAFTGDPRIVQIKGTTLWEKMKFVKESVAKFNGAVGCYVGNDNANLKPNAKFASVYARFKSQPEAQVDVQFSSSFEAIFFVLGIRNGYPLYEDKTTFDGQRPIYGRITTQHPDISSTKVREAISLLNSLRSIGITPETLIKHYTAIKGSPQE